MSKLLWGTVEITVPKQMIEGRNESGKVFTMNPLTATNNIRKYLGKPSIKLVPGDIKRPEIVRRGILRDVADLTKATENNFVILKKMRANKERALKSKPEPKKYTDTYKEWRDALTGAGAKDIPPFFWNTRLLLTEKIGLDQNKDRKKLHFRFTREGLNNFNKVENKRYTITFEKIRSGLGNEEQEVKQAESFNFLKQLADKPKPQSKPAQYVKADLSKYNKKELIQAIKPYWNNALREKFKKDMKRRGLDDAKYFDKIDQDLAYMVSPDLKTLINMEGIKMLKK
jgi:hypothetical protein